jgi:hypothetical protein
LAVGDVIVRSTELHPKQDASINAFLAGEALTVIEVGPDYTTVRHAGDLEGRYDTPIIIAYLTTDYFQKENDQEIIQNELSGKMGLN